MVRPRFSYVLVALSLLSVAGGALFAQARTPLHPTDELPEAAIAAIEKMGGRFREKIDPGSGEKSFVIELGHSHATDAGLKDLAALQNVSVLDLGDTKVTD